MASHHGSTGLVLSSAGAISCDKAGLWTGSCVFTFPAGRLDLLPGAGAVHPHASFLHGESFRVSFTQGLWQLSVEYAGMSYSSNPPPQFELSPGTGSEPIETHPKFVTDMAGKPSALLNGAIWRDQDTGLVTKDNSLGVFDRFHVLVDGERGKYAGVSAYICQNNTVWTKSWTARSAPATRGIRIGNPEGSYPNYGGKYNWLAMPVAYTMRAQVFSCSARWLCSGPNGWDKTIYASS